LFERAGIDYEQWRVLVRTFIGIDLEALRTAGRLGARRAATGLVGVVLVFGLAGFSPAMVAWFSPDPLLAGT